MSQITDTPSGTILEEIELGGYGAFPDKLFLIGVGGDKYACNNATLPDGQNADGLATFPDPDEATTYMGLLAGLSGSIVAKSFEEAREIAKSKPRLSCMFLFVAGKIVEVHYVR
jgi:hypothetical protein